MRVHAKILVGIGLVTGSAAHTAETITYTYDARGRLVQVQRSGTVNNGANATYAYDKTDNRTSVTTTAGGGGMAAASPPPKTAPGTDPKTGRSRPE